MPFRNKLILGYNFSLWPVYRRAALVGEYLQQQVLITVLYSFANTQHNECLKVTHQTSTFYGPRTFP